MGALPKALHSQYFSSYNYPTNETSKL